METVDSLITNSVNSLKAFLLMHGEGAIFQLVPKSVNWDVSFHMRILAAFNANFKPTDNLAQTTLFVFQHV